MEIKIKGQEGNFIRATPSLRSLLIMNEMEDTKGYIAIINIQYNLPEDLPNSK